jgi:hypothetical protein
MRPFVDAIATLSRSCHSIYLLTIFVFNQDDKRLDFAETLALAASVSFDVTNAVNSTLSSHLRLLK